MDKIINEYDKASMFKQECIPYLEKVISFCTVNSIPFFFSACVANDAVKSEYISDGVMTGSHNINLTDDRIAKHMLLNNGFNVITPYDEVETGMLFDDFDNPYDDE